MLSPTLLRPLPLVPPVGDADRVARRWSRASYPLTPTVAAGLAAHAARGGVAPDRLALAAVAEALRGAWNAQAPAVRVGLLDVHPDADDRRAGSFAPPRPWALAAPEDAEHATVGERLLALVADVTPVDGAADGPAHDLGVAGDVAGPSDDDGALPVLLAPGWRGGPAGSRQPHAPGHRMTIGVALDPEPTIAVALIPSLTAVAADALAGELAALLERTLAAWDDHGPVPAAALVDDDGRALPTARDHDDAELLRVLRRLPDVTDAAVTHDAAGAWAWVTGPPTDVALDPQIRRRHPQLAPWAATVVPGGLPRHADGTLDVGAARRNAPQAPPRLAALIDQVGSAADDARTLRRIWCEELGCERVETDDRFFAAGGHSLVAAVIASRIRAELERQIDLAELLGLLPHVRYGELEAEVLARPRATAPTILAVADPGGRHERFPVTAQQQAYLLGRGGAFSSGNVACHTYYEFDGPAVDPQRLAVAWRRTLERHDALRLQFDADALEQWLPEGPVDHPPVEIDLRGRPRNEVDAELLAVRGRYSHLIRPIHGAPLIDLIHVRHDDGSRICIGADALVADIAATSVIFDDLGAIYADPDADPPLPSVGYRDYVLAEERAIAGPDGDRARSHWRRRLPELGPAPDLPLARDPRTLEQPEFVPQPFQIEPDTWRALRERAAARGLSPSTVLLAAYAETIGAWSASPEFTLNLPRANRLPLAPDADGIVGECASFSLLPMVTGDDRSFAERAVDAQTRHWDDLGHQHVPGMHVLRDLLRRRGGLGQAQMPIVFTSAIDLAGDPTSLLDGRLRRSYRLAQTPQVWMDLIVEEHGDRLFVNWDSVRALFPEGLIPAMAAALEGLLRRLATDDDAWDATTIDLRADADRRAATAAVTPLGSPVDEPAHAALLRQAAERPDRTAVIGDDARLTFGALVDAARRVAGPIAARATAPDRPVAIVAGKGPDQIVAALATQLAGVPYLPIDPDLPDARVRALLDQADPAFVLGDATSAAERAHGRPFLRVAAAAVGDLPLPDALPRAAPDDLAYVLFTSGSTGTPKGVMVPHRGIVVCVRETLRETGLGPDDRALALTALHHDMSAFDLFGVLGAGAALIVPDELHRREPERWATAMRTHGVTFWNSVPAMLEMLLDHVADDGTALAALRTAMLGGDWVAPELIERLWAHVPEARAYSVGGPSETTIWNIWHRIERDDLAGPSIPYGRPIAGTRYDVLDAAGRERPTWATGELYCTGVGVSRGYLDDAERTAAAFVPHPDPARDGERAYRTGDLGRRRPDGTLEFVGRADFQVKVRGQRIELGSIEAALRAQPGVERAVVVGVPHRERAGFRGLAGYVVADPSAAVDPDALRVALRETLAPHEVPATITVLDRLPLNAGGKLDRTRLPPPPDEVAAPTRDPRDALDRVLTAAWSRALDVPAVGIDDDFFLLGGDSLVATRLLADLRDALPGVRASLRDVFTGLTVAGLADRLRDADVTPGRTLRIAEIAERVAAMDAGEIDARLERRS